MTRLPVAGRAEVWAVVRELSRGRRARALVTAATLLAAAGTGLLAPLLIGEIVGRVEDGRGVSAIVVPAIALLAAGIADAALTGLGVALVAALAQPMVADLRERVVDRALRIPSERVERGGRGDLLARVGDDVAALASAVVESLPAIATAALTILLTFAGLAAIDPRLALAGLLAVPVQVYSVRWFLPRAAPAYAGERTVSGDRAQAVLEVVGGARTLRALGLGDARLARVRDVSRTGVDAVVRTIRISTGLYARLNGAEFVGTAAVLGAGFLLVRSGSISIGAATAGALLFVRLFGYFNVVLGTLDEAQRALAALARLVGVATLEPPRDPDDPPVPRGADVRVTGVTHAYEAGHPVLHDIDLVLAPGERVALVGESGAGKTTLAKVVAGFHEPVAGEVRIGGAALAALGPAATRRVVALVTQEVHVFAGTLADDLRLAAPHADDGALHAALAAAGAGDWVARLPDGLDTKVGEGGVALTAAQAQQIALARLVLADPLVAVLDEATAEAGSAGARILEAAADRVLAGRTALVVAHRLTQAARSDRIVVLEHGRIVEQGTHDELLAAGGTYAGLWSAWSAHRPAPVTAPADG